MEKHMRIPKPVRGVVAGALGLAILGLLGWIYVSHAGRLVSPSSNAIMVIAPYRYNGTWVFDDTAAGLKREPFVAGVPEMLDVLVREVPSTRTGSGSSFRPILFRAIKSG